MVQDSRITSFCNLCNHEFSRPVFIKNGYILLRCSSCGLVYVGNPPSKLELEKLYSFDSGYHLGLQDDSGDFKRDLDLAIKYYELITKYKTHGRILDIGCAAGFFLKVAKENGWDTYGVEISNDTAEIARKRYGLKVLTGSLKATSFIPNFFDVVTMWDVIEHVENPIRTISIISRILKDDGILAISTPNIDGLFPKISYRVSNLINRWRHPEPPHHLYQFSKKTMNRLLEQAGFNLLEVQDRCIPITYSFGSFETLISSPKRFLYSAFFIPTALLGPIVHMGDCMIVIAKKAREYRIDS